VAVGVAEGIGDGGSGVKVEEVKRDGVTETVAEGDGERRGNRDGVDRGVSLEAHAANPRLMRTIAKREFCRR